MEPKNQVTLYRFTTTRGWKSGVRSLSWKSGWNPCTLAPSRCWTYAKTFFRFQEQAIWQFPEVQLSRASLTVMFTVKSGNPPKAGKIWENRFFTMKISRQTPFKPKIDHNTCQGFCRTFQDFFRLLSWHLWALFHEWKGSKADRAEKST